MAPKTSFWQRCRVAFRWCRISTWLLVLILVSVFFWINQIGLPNFLKIRLLNSLHSRGIELEFTRMRWRVTRGIVAENVRIGGVSPDISPVLSLAEIQLKLDHHALVHRQLRLNELILHEGKLTWTLSPTNVLMLNNIECQFRIQTNDVWTLDRLNADLGFARLCVAGEIAHAPELQHWPLFHLRPNGPQEPLQIQIKRISDQYNRIHFEGFPQLNLALNGDARDIDSFKLKLSLAAPGAETPWGHFRAVALTAKINPPATSGPPPLLQIKLTVASAKTPWVHLDQGTLDLQTLAVLTNVLPPVVLEFQADRINSRWGDASDLTLNAGIQSAPVPNTNNDLPLGYWTNAIPFQLSWNTRVSELAAQKLVASNVTFGGSWQYPLLAITNISATLGNGLLKADVGLNAASRQLSFTNSSNFDLHRIAPVLTEKTRSRLDLVHWTQPPRLNAGGSLTLPAWINRQPDWRLEVQPSIRLHGQFAFTNATFMQVPLDIVNSQFFYSNLVWTLPDLSVVESQTRLLINTDEDENSKSFHAHLAGVFDPQAIGPFLVASNAVRTFQYFNFQEPLGLDVNVAGHLYDYHDLMAGGSLALTNAAFKEQSVETVTTRFLYTNRTVAFFNPEMWRAGHSQTLRADSIYLDLPGQKIWFTNGFSTTEVMVVGRAIGPKTTAAMAPYEFLANPTVRVNGCVPLRMQGEDLITDDADMRFEMLAAAPFRWRTFQTPHILGNVRWLANSLIITNVTAETYGGQAQGWGVFDLRTKQPGTDFRFFVSITNVNFHQMAVELWSPTNHLEGALSGSVKVSRANSEDWRQWFGYGQAQLQDGLIWDIPMFGVLSPVLNTVSPGLGSSRATDASASFLMTNGVISTDSMVIRSTVSRLQYVGTIDLRENVNARVTVQFLRNTPVVGDIFSTLLYPFSKIFEYEVTGSLKDPKTAPYHDVSRLLIIPFEMPFHPFRTLGELLPTDAGTNAPVKK